MTKNPQQRKTSAQKKNRAWLWILIGFLGVIGILFLGVMAIGLITDGNNSQWNPAALGQPVTEGDVTICLTDVDTTNKTEDNKFYTLSTSRRVILKGNVTCELPEGETCTFKDLEVHLILPEGTLFVSTKGNRSVQEINGGETKYFRFESSDWIHGGEETSGTVMKLEFKGGGFLDVHTAWFDLGWK